MNTPIVTTGFGYHRKMFISGLDIGKSCKYLCLA